MPRIELKPSRSASAAELFSFNGYNKLELKTYNTFVLCKVTCIA